MSVMTVIIYPPTRLCFRRSWRADVRKASAMAAAFEEQALDQLTKDAK